MLKQTRKLKLEEINSGVVRAHNYKKKGNKRGSDEKKNDEKKKGGLTKWNRFICRC